MINKAENETKYEPDEFSNDASSNSAQYGGLHPRHQYTGMPIGGISKRCMDAVGAAFALVFLSPLFLLIAATIKANDGGPVFFKHRRIGRGGTEFYCLKFRTMVPNSENLLTQHLAQNSAADSEWQADRKLRIDPRITALGFCLRKSSIDELPQLFNILKGEMSFVGPRPIVAAEAIYYGECIQDYHRARPGLTGMWQVSGRNDTSYAFRVALDSHYVRAWSFWKDLKIIGRTFRVVLTARGSY